MKVKGGKALEGILEQIAGQLDGDAISKMSGLIGASSTETQRAVMGALPLLVGALDRNTNDEAGQRSLFDALSRDHDGSILDNVVGFLDSSDELAGNKILGHMLGGRRGQVETGLSKLSGIDVSSVSKLLPMLAPIIMGALGRAQRERGFDAAGLGSLLSEERTRVEGREPQAMGALAKLLDTDGDGNVMDDVARIGSGFLGGLLKSR